MECVMRGGGNKEVKSGINNTNTSQESDMFLNIKLICVPLNLSAGIFGLRR